MPFSSRRARPRGEVAGRSGTQAEHRLVEGGEEPRRVLTQQDLDQRAAEGLGSVSAGPLAPGEGAELLDQDGAILTPLAEQRGGAHRGRPKPVDPAQESGERRPEAPMKYGEGLTSQILRSREPLLLNRREQHERQESLGTPSLSCRGVPILVQGECVGAVGVSGVQSHEDEQLCNAGIAALQ